MKLTQEEIDNLTYLSRSDSSKIIEYMEEKENQRKSQNRIIFVCTIIGTIGSIIAAITGIVLLFG